MYIAHSLEHFGIVAGTSTVSCGFLL